MDEDWRPYKTRDKVLVYNVLTFRALDTGWGRSVWVKTHANGNALVFQIREAQTDLATGCTIRGSNPGTSKRFSSFPNCTDRLWGAKPAICTLRIGGKAGRAWRWPSSVEFKNERNYTSAPHLYLRGVGRGQLHLSFSFFNQSTRSPPEYVAMAASRINLLVLTFAERNRWTPVHYLVTYLKLV